MWGDDSGRGCGRLEDLPHAIVLSSITLRLIQIVRHQVRGLSGFMASWRLATVRGRP